MLQIIKARYIKGRIEPIEPLLLEEGAEVEVTVSVTSPMIGTSQATRSTAGAWSTLLDCEEFEEELYQNRLINNRPEVSL